MRAKHRGLMEDPITFNEISKAIDGLKSNKAPGLDGLMAEFYKKVKVVPFAVFAKCLVHI